MNIIVVDSGSNISILETIVNSQSINVVGAIIEQPNKPISSIHQNYLLEKAIPIIDFNDLKNIQHDLVLVITWGKRIADEIVNTYNIINIHGGILPKWRGFASNVWAIINGEKKVGYTVHKMTSELDGGDIYHIYETEISDTELYGDAR